MGESRKGEVRCAIYTRKSSEEGLEQDFNSLHAQREACEAFIKSQKHEGWVALPTVYDDGGFSGGSMDRPALQQLLEDIREKRVDVVVVYKVDRLTRSLADFAKIVEVFDDAGVSFVSVTQQFNTTSSMGRLTLNVLLSFAQFEREVTGERIRDKIAASKKKGLWMGGIVPMGYRPHERTLVIDNDEAEIIRTIYRLYLELGSVRQVEAELKRRQLRTRAFVSATNKTWGDRPFSHGHLRRILTNPIYAGRIAHRDAQYEGQHPAIIDQGTWDLVQARLAAKAVERQVDANTKEKSLLAGILLDADGKKLTCSHAVKGAKRYRYYVGARPEGRGAKAWRLPAHGIEDAVVGELNRFLTNDEAIAEALGPLGLDAHELNSALLVAKDLAAGFGRPASREPLAKLVRRVDVSEDDLGIELRLDALASSASPEATHKLVVPVAFRRRGGEIAIVLPNSPRGEKEPDPTIIKSIARGFTWFEELATGETATVKAIAEREGLTDRYVSRLIELAFLSPRIIERHLSGVQPIDLSAEDLARKTELDPVWRVQEQQVLA